MAEIKSTLDLVMEKLAQLDKKVPAEADGDEIVKQGMRLGAEYMRGQTSGLGEKVKNSPAPERAYLQKGLVNSLLRNIFLPREEEQQRLAEKAVQGLLEIAQGDRELHSVFSDMKNILERYTQHRKQLRQQLEEMFSQQMEKLGKTLAQQTGMTMKLDPSQHPKFKEEWQRVQADLNEQYGRAITQYKAVVEERLA